MSSFFLNPHVIVEAGGVGRVSILPDCMDGWNCVELGSQPFVTLPNLLRTELFFVVCVIDELLFSTRTFRVACPLTSFVIVLVRFL